MAKTGWRRFFLSKNMPIFEYMAVLQYDGQLIIRKWKMSNISHNSKQTHWAQLRYNDVSYGRAAVGKSIFFKHLTQFPRCHFDEIGLSRYMTYFLIIFQRWTYVEIMDGINVEFLIRSTSTIDILWCYARYRYDDHSFISMLYFQIRRTLLIDFIWQLTL